MRVAWVALAACWTGSAPAPVLAPKSLVREVVVSSVDDVKVLRVDRDGIYWADFHAIWRADKTAHARPQQLYSAPEKRFVGGLAVHDGRLYFGETSFVNVIATTGGTPRPIATVEPNVWDVVVHDGWIDIAVVSPPGEVGFVPSWVRSTEAGELVERADSAPVVLHFDSHFTSVGREIAMQPDDDEDLVDYAVQSGRDIYVGTKSAIRHAGDLRVLARTSSWVTAMAVDAHDVYWAEDGAIYRVARTGGPRSLVARTGAVTAMASDGEAVYWADATTGAIARIRL